MGIYLGKIIESVNFYCKICGEFVESINVKDMKSNWEYVSVKSKKCNNCGINFR